MKKRYFIILPALVLLTLTGCLSDNEGENQNNNQQNGLSQVNKDQRFNRGEDSSEDAIVDLEVGQQIFVMGMENSDGSITADQIIIGDLETNFDEMIQNIRIEDSPEASDEGMDNTPQGRPDTQNFLEEEKSLLREQMKSAGSAEGVARSGSVNREQIIKIQGEIIKKDDEVLTLKLTDGGSKFIFLSDSTIILKTR
jgi:hypothetical protein